MLTRNSSRRESGCLHLTVHAPTQRSPSVTGSGHSRSVTVDTDACKPTPSLNAIPSYHVRLVRHGPLSPFSCGCVNVSLRLWLCQSLPSSVVVSVSPSSCGCVSVSLILRLPLSLSLSLSLSWLCQSLHSPTFVSVSPFSYSCVSLSLLLWLCQSLPSMVVSVSPFSCGCVGPPVPNSDQG